VVLKQLKRITGTQPYILITDRGYRGEKNYGKIQILTPSRTSPDDTEYKKRKQRKRFRKRAGIEANISLLKQDLRPGRWLLKGEIGDQINVTLSSASKKLRNWIRFRLELFLNLVSKTHNNMFTGNLNYYTVTLLSKTVF